MAAPEIKTSQKVRLNHRLNQTSTGTVTGTLPASEINGRLVSPPEAYVVWDDDSAENGWFPLKYLKVIKE